ncbi:hypothetical protein X275_05595 [Marinitoga sp. 1197]|uniref:ABC transporter permease subunit n=1 Tax=Marinitoga sp. 1197 TaxID=1428449 RepID=UPI000657C0AA|nr:ABC transporter permease subunit [Marinitoga sp. 1197]KLO22755.1 hypothetical protein X275_05595 [Marinitoga sp. 1197]
MMIQKKNYILRHIFLIIVIILVLFPLVWVVTTSIRRDNAAFSPKLFSSRITLNYYRDLLFPKATVPELIKDINGTAHFIGENSKLTLDEANKKLFNELKDFEIYIDETNEYLNNIQKRFIDMQKSLYGKDMDNIIEDINKARIKEFEKLEKMEDLFLEGSFLSDANLKSINSQKEELNNAITNYYYLRTEILNLLSDIKKTDDNSKYYDNTIYTIFSIKPNYTLWKIKNYKKWVKIENNEKLLILNTKIKNLSNEWKNILSKAKNIDNSMNALEQKFLGKDLENINNYSSEIKNIQKELSKIKNNISKSQNIVLKYTSDLTSLLELYAPDSLKIESAVNILKNYKKDKVNSTEVIALSEKINFISNTFEIINNKIQQLSDFEIYKNSIQKYYESFLWLKNNLEYINPDLEYITPAYKTVFEIIDNIDSTLNTLKALTINLTDNLAILEKYQNSYNQLDSKLKAFSTKYDELYNKNKTVLDNFKKLKKYGEFLIIKSFSNLEIKNYYESEFFADLLNSKLFEFYKPLKRDLIVFTLRNNIEEAKNKFYLSMSSFEKLISEIKPNIEKLKSNANDYLKINYNGYTADILPILEISSIYNSKFGPVKANISRSSRIVSDLADSVKYKSLKTDLRKIDADIYDLLDKWNPKQRKPFLRWLLNSIIVAGVTSILTVLMTAVAAYPFSRMRFFGRKEGLLYLMLIQMFPAIMYMVALYGILKFMGDYFGFIGLDTLAGLIFVYLGGVSFNMWLIKGYYDTIPDSLEESAMIDGATRFQTFWRIVLPLASPILAVVTILSFMGTFNEFVMARIVLSSEQNYTYAVGLQTFTSGPFETEWGLFTAAALLGAVPMVLLFLSMQKYLVGGLTQGSVKG